MYRIEDEGKVCGFFAVDGKKTILQFYLKEESLGLSDSIFNELIAGNEVRKALCGSNDPLFHKQCTRKAVKSENHDFMFHEDKAVTVALPFEGILMESPGIEKLDEILSYSDLRGRSSEQGRCVPAALRDLPMWE